MSQATAKKICVLCGQDCSDRQRIRDPKGRYYCRECYESTRDRLIARYSTGPSGDNGAAPPIANGPADSPAPRPAAAHGRNETGSAPAPPAPPPSLNRSHRSPPDLGPPPIPVADPAPVKVEVKPKPKTGAVVFTPKPKKRRGRRKKKTDDAADREIHRPQPALGPPPPASPPEPARQSAGLPPPPRPALASFAFIACPGCGRPVPAPTVVCMDCGFNFQTGRHVDTTTGQPADDGASVARRLGSLAGHPAVIVLVALAVIGGLSVAGLALLEWDVGRLAAGVAPFLGGG